MPHSLHVPAFLKALLPSGPHVRRLPFGAARGLDFTIDFDRHLRFYLGLYETELTPWFARFARPGTVAYDVGADVGFQALVIARRTSAPVVGFEPRSEAAEQIERHYELNRDRIGQLQVVRSKVGRESLPGETSLDDFEAQSSLAPPGLLLVDVDGGEVDVLEGASRLLREVRPHLVIETHSASLERECLSILVQAGYRPVVVKNRRVLGDFRPIALNRWIAAEGN
jgi:hypothetical protein